VAYNASITGVNILNAMTYGFKDYVTEAGQAAFLSVIAQARGLDIMVNPWDETPSFSENQSNINTFEYRYLDQLEQNLTVGRNGLGTIVVQASGDDGSDANGSGMNASRYTLSVAATDMNGIASISSNFGSSILLAAPAAAYTTDLIGDDGFNQSGNSESTEPDQLPNTDYTSVFGGTAAATGVVSGVVALMLDANPNLGWRDAQNILALSASHTGSDLGASIMASEHGGWEINGARNWNGGGLSVNGSYGYGIINAYAAVRMAEAWAVIYDTALTSTNEVTSITNTVDLGAGMALPLNGDEIGFDIVSTVDISIEYIQLNLNFEHSFIGDVEVFLTDPNGTKIQVVFTNNTPTGFSGTWRYGVDSLLGVSSIGTWNISMSDAFNDADNGVLFGGSIEFFGSPQGIDDVYNFTTDFLDYSVYEIQRSTIIDTNGGIDWVNFSSVPGDLLINLSSGSFFSVDGNPWGNFALANSDQFENVISGDGDDFITGNALDNVLHGMRGNDRIVAGAGNDNLFGGDGADTLNAGDGDDLIFGGETSRDLRDLVFAGAGNDSIDAGYGNDEIFGQSGNDTVAGGFGSDTLQGQDGNDVLTGSALSDLVFGNAGDDFVNGGFGHDRINGGTGADRFFHLGILDHGSDFIQDYSATQGDLLLFGIPGATRSQFQVNISDAVALDGEKAGDDIVQEAFVIYRPTGQIMWALIDGAGQSSINLQLGSDVFDLLA
jgi:Ca2+-binding RTX toxin-like protein